MPDQSHFSIPSISLTSTALVESAFKSLEMENDKKNVINKEMATDILMLALLTIVPVVLVLAL